MGELCERFGGDRVEAAFYSIIHRCAEVLRSGGLPLVPDAEFVGEDFVGNDGLTLNKPVKLKLTVRKYPLTIAFWSATGRISTSTQSDQSNLRLLSAHLTTVIGSEGVHGSVQPAARGKAAFESEVTVTGETSFLESGSIRFGDGNHRLRFSTVAQGYLGDSSAPKLKSGAVTWRVAGGEG